MGYIMRMITPFEALADPTRRRILNLLRERPHLVGELVMLLDLSQPLVSKHLRVLREADLVRVRQDAQRRWYELNLEPLAEVDAWMGPYRQLWTGFDRLDTLLNKLQEMPFVLNQYSALSTQHSIQERTHMNTLTSKDGTTIAFDQSGQGPALILVGGMFEQRAMESETSQLAAWSRLSEHFTVYHYDRRGRGSSTDTQPFAVEREIEDIEALIDHAGGSAFVYGISSGAALAFESALKLGSKVKKLAIYDPPYNDDPGAREGWKWFRQELEHTLSEGRRGDAVGLFMELTGATPEQIEELRSYPMWPMWEDIAPTIAYDAAVVGEEAAVPTESAANLTVPTLVMNGEQSYPFMHESGSTLAKAIPNAQYRVLDGQPHEVAADAVGPVLIEFFK
jgi:pimeloyl-ACP methyl ester carboxylesterase/DNA-binding transcriptional ArsR family regulator